jgi:hypothetical protein
MTMKMISSTNNTSMSGVTLISALAPPEPPTAIAISSKPFQLKTFKKLYNRTGV